MAEIPAGWPCATLPVAPPSVVDRQAFPTADDILPQILALTPRGPAWGTDEAGDGRGASPIMRLFWRAIAAWVADANTREFDLAVQALPSAITWSLSDWEREYDLPDMCTAGDGSTAARVAALRARFAGVGGSSPAYFVCLAQSVGYDISIEEPTQFRVDVSECSGPEMGETWFTCEEGECGSPEIEEAWFTCDEGECDGTPLETVILTGSPETALGTPLEGFSFPDPTDVQATDEVAGGLIETFFECDAGECDGTPLEDVAEDPNGSMWKFWVVHVASLGETWFRCDEGEVSVDPLEGFLPAADLECLFRRLAPPHTELVFNYAEA